MATKRIRRRTSKGGMTQAEKNAKNRANQLSVSLSDNEQGDENVPFNHRFGTKNHANSKKREEEANRARNLKSKKNAENALKRGKNFTQNDTPFQRNGRFGTKKNEMGFFGKMVSRITGN